MISVFSPASNECKVKHMGKKFLIENTQRDSNHLIVFSNKIACRPCHILCFVKRKKMYASVIFRPC